MPLRSQPTSFRGLIYQLALSFIVTLRTLDTAV